MGSSQAQPPRTPTNSDFPPSMAVPHGNPAVSGTTALPTTSLSIHPPDFRMNAPPLRRNPTSPTTQNTNLAPSLQSNQSYSGASTPSHLSISSTLESTSISSPASSSPRSLSPNTHPKGHLTVKLMSARGLNIPSEAMATSRPYVVVTFENNEFVSREPIESHEPTTKGVATYTPSAPPTPSSGILGIGSISRAFDMAARSRSAAMMGKTKLTLPGAKSGATTPKATESRSEWLGKPSACDPVWKHEVTFDLVSETSLIYITVYDRAQEGEGFLGIREIRPVCRNGFVMDSWFKLGTRGTEEVSGEVRVQIRYDVAQSKTHLTPRDFEFLKLIGRGTFGRVFQVRKRDTKRIYAMKVLSKKEIVAKKEVAHTIGERKILQTSLECPFLVGLKFSFQTEKQLYFVTDYKSGGELFWHLQKEGRFTEERARFYIAELVLALEHLHKYDIVYRDLKPENILLDATGHVALCDFGLSKPDLAADQLTNTFCGTTEYLAPEVLLDDNGYSKLVDFWSLGVLLFEMCCGWSPFYAEDTQQMYKNICFGKIRFPRGVIDEDGKQFVKGLLNRNPKHRLGATRDAAELKDHPFFKSVDWVALASKQVTPPFKPVVESDESVANFDPEFTSTSVQSANPFEEDDPIEGWVNQPSNGINAAGGGAGNGTNGTSSSMVGSMSGGTGMAIKSTPQRPGLNPLGGSPLTSSVQENFRGFTYSGESMIRPPDGILIDDDGEALEEDEDALDPEDYDEDEDAEREEEEEEGTRLVRGVLRRDADIDMED
ncbi:kinase-like domain-containing protein [Mrakia frigida]|uniref:serine/threonine-protein kinase n=1 Tax=Mrakia frigida TaxID=29902 RepID=UPI003FCBFD6B